MPNANKIILMGHLTRDIELRHTASGTVVGNGGICVNNIKKGGEKQPCFVDFTCFGKTAEIADKYLSKGSAAYLEGHLEMQEWNDKNTGAKRTKHVIIVQNLQFVGEKNASGGGQGSASHSVAEDTDEIPF